MQCHETTPLHDWMMVLLLLVTFPGSVDSPEQQCDDHNLQVLPPAPFCVRVMPQDPPHVFTGGQRKDPGDKHKDLQLHHEEGRGGRGRSQPQV